MVHSTRLTAESKSEAIKKYPGTVWYGMVLRLVISVVKKVVSVVMGGRQNVVKCLQFGRQKVFRCRHMGRQKVFTCRHLGRHNVVRSSRGSMQGRHLGRKLIEKL